MCPALRVAPEGLARKQRNRLRHAVSSGRQPILNRRGTTIATAEFHVFRDSTRRVPATELIVRLRTGLCHLSRDVHLDELTGLLLQAGEMEGALDDAGCTCDAPSYAASLTNLLAEAAVGSDMAAGTLDCESLCSRARRLLDAIGCAEILSVATPEGFAYYGLHPLDYADLVKRQKVSGARAFIVGIRTIGTALSAVVGAQLGKLGILAERVTVRPTGHPYDRTCEFDGRQREMVAAAAVSGAEFYVCDEGPGRSGSSLLSVAEALEREGVRRDRIVLLCSHHANVGKLCAPDASSRWARYRSAASGMTQRLPGDVEKFVGGGDWRRMLLARGEPWPAVWPQMERLKYLSRDGQRLLTFEGYGTYGAQVSARNQALAADGFGAPYGGHKTGFGGHALPPGRLGRRQDLTPARLRRMAQYCAWRGQRFGVSEVDNGALETMARVNLEREFGWAPCELALPLVCPAICDARMAPHDWLLTEDGRWLKLDGAIHGDDHFFPGPTDIAWDLAGMVVEWELSAHEREFLLAAYMHASGDCAANRLPVYEVAYAAFRMAWSKMAAASVEGSEAEEGLLRDYRKYRQWVQRTGEKFKYRESA